MQGVTENVVGVSRKGAKVTQRRGEIFCAPLLTLRLCVKTIYGVDREGFSDDAACRIREEYRA